MRAVSDRRYSQVKRTNVTTLASRLQTPLHHAIASVNLTVPIRLPKQLLDRRLRVYDDPSRQVGQQINLSGRQLSIKRAVVREVILHAVKLTKDLLYIRRQLVVP